MKAVRYYGKNDVRIVDIEKPKPKPGEVLIKIGGAGVCHSDLHVIHDGLKFPQQSFTLGHENAGWIEELGEGVTGYSVGDAVAVFGPWGCGHCHPCQESKENYCDHQAEIGGLGGGIGFDGGMAEYMIVPSSRLLIPLGELSPRQAAPLTDAGLTPYHAIKRSASKLTSSNFVVVIGIGGLGHMAIQILKATCASTIIACDVSNDKLELAKKHGADYTFNTTQDNVAEQIIKLTGSKKCAVVFDFVGINPTIKLGSKIVGLDSHWTIVGLGGGHYQLTAGTTEAGADNLPYGCSITVPYWGARTELMEVIDLAKRGVIHVEIEEYPLSKALEVYEKLDQGKIKGRAVLIP